MIGVIFFYLFVVAQGIMGAILVSVITVYIIKSIIEGVWEWLS